MNDKQFDLVVNDMINSIERNGVPNCSLEEYCTFFEMPKSRYSVAVKRIKERFPNLIGETNGRNIE
jgi:hypothetical protein